MSDTWSPLGSWRLTVRRLGDALGGDEGPVEILARVDVGGALTVVVAGRANDPGLGAWRAAGPGRLVLVAEWFVADIEGSTGGLLVVRAAAELSSDGGRCAARLLGQRFAADGLPLHPAVSGEAVGARIQS